MTPTPAHDTVYGTVEKAPDLEVHIKVTEVDGIRLLNMREFILSTATYGRGLTLPLDLTPALIDALNEVRKAEDLP